MVINSSPVSIISGDTGSGKSTQLPQYLVDEQLENMDEDQEDTLPRRSIMVTQPTRIAALNAAKRVADERGCKLGTKVGYRIGGAGLSSPETEILFCTAPWLLTYITQNEAVFRSKRPPFTHLIIDEVHGRSTSSDLLCLIAKQVLHKWGLTGRVRVILMSATVQEHKLRDYYNDIVQEYNGTSPLEPLEQIPSFHVGVSRYPVKEIYLEDEIIQATPVASEATSPRWS